MKRIEYVITICTSVFATIIILLCFNLINVEESKEISSLNENISLLQQEINSLKEDKSFYKKLYSDLAEDYNNRLQDLGIDEYILTDTSR